MQGKYRKVISALGESFGNIIGGLSKSLSPLMIGKRPSKLLLSDDKVGYGGRPTDPIELANKKYVDDAVHNPSGNVSIDGDLNISGNTLSFGNGEILHNEGDGVVTIKSPSFVLDNSATGMANVAIFPDSGSDAKINLYNAALIKWTIGNDADDSDTLKFDAGNVLVGGATKASLDSSGNMTLVGDLAVNGDDITTDGNMNLDSGGSLTLDAHDGSFIAKKAGTEFSAANSAYAGMILGYTQIHNLSSLVSWEIQNSITVEDDTHKISFKTPPSENVEIEVTAMFNVSSTDTKVVAGLSTANATDGYSAVHGSMEYDSAGIMFSDDEANDHVKVFKFVVGASYLEAVGADNTFWLGFSTAGSTKTVYLQTGFRSSHGIASHPLIIKATALPATIYDGS